SSLADAEPEPLTLANLTTKSLVDWSGAWAGVMRGLPACTGLGAGCRLPSSSFPPSFPRRRESSPPPAGNCYRQASHWLPAFAGMTIPESPRLRPLRHSCRLPRPPVATPRPGMRLQQQELLHVPGPGRAAFGAQAAVQADVLVLDHHPPCFQRLRHVQRLF